MSHRSFRLPALLALATLALAPAGAAVAQGAAAPKLGVIEVEQILLRSEAGQAAIANLQQKREELEAELERLRGEAEALRDEIATGRLSLSEESLRDKRQQLEQKAIALERAEDDANRELEKERQRAFQEIEERVLPVIQEVGRELGMTMIFNKYQSGLVYADESIDITATVIERFDAAAAAAAAPAEGG